MSLTVIVGLGDTGLACARYLQKQGVPFAITDSRKEPPHLKAFLEAFPQVDYHVGDFSEKLLDQATEIVLSPGVALKEPVIAKQVAKQKSIVGDIELFARAVKKPVIGITGSNGKTSVTTLMGLMVNQTGKKATVCGNIGDPVLDMLNAQVPDFYVIELSSFQLETTYSLHPATSTILNISPNHLDRYTGLQAYLEAKQRIYLNCQAPVVNDDESHIWKDLSFKQSPIKFSIQDKANGDFYLKNQGELFLMHRDKKLIAVKELKLQAQHHLKNALAGLALGSAIELPMAPMLEVLRNFSGLPHRCQWVRNFHGVDYFNDSKGTSIGATEAALTSLGQSKKGKLILIAGGQSKGVDFAPLQTPVKKYVDQLILIGEDAPLLEKALQGIAPIAHAKSMDDAVAQATHLAKSGDIVLLSPACASFDMFKNYKHRGETFAQIVESL